jgi:L-amino acid N-acyltransferase YncA
VLRIRRALAADLPGIFAIFHDEVQHGTSSLEERTFSAAEQQAWLHAHHSEVHPAFVAALGDEILAFGTLTQLWPESACARSAEVSIHVHRHSGRDGLGHDMLHELITHARAVDLAVLIARVSSDNQASIELHLECGFRHVGKLRHVAKKFGRLLDVDLFEFELPGVETRSSSASPVAD